MGIGVDIVDIEEFIEKLNRGGNSFLNRYYSATELKNIKPEHLAGIFAAKEAVFKTGILKELNFLSIQILKNNSASFFTIVLSIGSYGINSIPILELIIALCVKNKAVSAVMNRTFSSSPAKA